jgi:hypothetical protein
VDSDQFARLFRLARGVLWPWRFPYVCGPRECDPVGKKDREDQTPEARQKAGRSCTSKARRKKQRNLRKHQNPAAVAQAFTYFDCTDYIDEPGSKGILTEARNYKAHDPNGRIPYLEHIKLLWKYASWLVPANEYIDVHGGFFKGAVTNIAMIAVPILRFC